MIEARGLQDAVSVMSHVSAAELPALYRHAAMLLFPSRYEGFGWPPLEAMQENCPVVCSTAASLPEVVGDAALTAAFDNEDTLAAHCVELLRNAALADDLRARGRQHAKQFSLQKMANAMAEVYGSLGA